MPDVETVERLVKDLFNHPDHEEDFDPYADDGRLVHDDEEFYEDFDEYDEEEKSTSNENVKIEIHFH